MAKQQHQGTYTHLILQNASEHSDGVVDRLTDRKLVYEEQAKTDDYQQQITAAADMPAFEAQVARRNDHYVSVCEALNHLQSE